MSDWTFQILFDIFKTELASIQGGILQEDQEIQRPRKSVYRDEKKKTNK